MALKRTFEILYEIEAINRAENMQRTFEAGEKIEGNYSADKQTVIYQGYEIPVENVKDLGIKKSVLMLAGIGLAFIIIAVLVFMYFKKKK
jgi:hypothetical protein